MEPLPVDMMWFRILAGVLVGLVMGSFTTMLSYRVPRRISIVQPPSHCPNCKTPLTAIDLVPVVSWVASGGKCSHCKAPIHFRYVAIELVTTIAITLAFAMLGFRLRLIPAVLAIVAAVTAITVNLERGKDS